MDKEPIIDRALYRTIKGMSRQEIDKLLSHMYGIGAEEAATELQKSVLAAIKNIPGIGEKRFSQIEETISPIFENCKPQK